MNRYSLSTLLGAGLLLGPSYAAEAPRALSDSPPVVLERGGHHRVEEFVTTTVDESGQPLLLTNRYTVLSPGLHYLENGEWRETVVAFEPIPGGWVARRGPHQVTLADDLRVAGAVEVTSAEGTRLRGTPLQLFLYDRQADRSVVLGELQSSHGEQVEPNVILYRDAFTTFPADVRVERSRV